MGKGILEQLEETLALENNNKYGRAMETLQDSSSSPKKREKAKKTILKIAIDTFRSDERLNGYLGSNERNLIESEIRPVENQEEITDSNFYRVIGLIENKCYYALSHYYLDYIIKSVYKVAKDAGCTTAARALSDVKRSDTPAVKKSKIKTALSEMLLEIRQRAHLNAQDKKENMKNRLAILMNMTTDITDRLDSKDKIDYWILQDDTLDLIGRMYKADKMIEKKIDSPVGEDEKIKGKDKKRGNKMENENKTTAMVKYEPKPLALKREEVKGHTDAPIEKPKKNYKKILMAIGGVVLAVTVVGGAYFLGTRQNSDDQDNKPGYEQDITEEELTEAVNIVHTNWTSHGIEYTQEDVAEIIKALNGMDSTLTIDQADEALMDVLNTAIVPGVNNVLGGESNETKDLDFASLILGNPEGLVAVEHMEDNLNGCLTDSENLLEYCEKAFVDEALIVAEGDSVDGMSAAEGTATPAGVRIVWSRLALGVNAFAGTLGDELNAEVEGQTYSQTDLNDGVAINNIATQAKREMGSIDRSMNMQ